MRVGTSGARSAPLLLQGWNPRRPQRGRRLWEPAELGSAPFPTWSLRAWRHVQPTSEKERL